MAGALNPDIYVPLDRNLPRLRNVNVTLDVEAARAERILQLKKTRSGFKSALTKKRNKFSDLLHREKIMELHQAFDNFKGAHDVYTKSLVEEDSIMESHEYFEDLRASIYTYAASTSSCFARRFNQSNRLRYQI